MPSNLIHLNWDIIPYGQMAVVMVLFIQLIIIFTFSMNLVKPLHRSLVLFPALFLSFFAIVFSLVIPMAYWFGE